MYVFYVIMNDQVEFVFVYFDCCGLSGFVGSVGCLVSCYDLKFSVEKYDY